LNRNKVILVIDDNKDSYDLTYRKLAIFKYTVLHADCIHEAKSILKSVYVDLFIIDHFLHEETGVSFLESDEFKTAQKKGSQAIYHSIEYKGEVIGLVQGFGVKYLSKLANKEVFRLLVNTMLKDPDK